MRKELIDFRLHMKEKGVDAYIVPSTDFHGSEYVNDYFKCRQFISGFTGSAGTLVITAEEAWLWTDGRYFLQASEQLQGSGIGLMKMGEPDTPSIEAYLEKAVPKDGTIGFDGRVIDCTFGNKLEQIAKVSFEEDLAGDIWHNRPSLSASKIYELPLSVTGESFASKLERLRFLMKARGADYHLITKLEEIAWLFNLRGADIKHTPVFYSFALIGLKKAYLYVMDESFAYAGEAEVKPYTDFFADIKKLAAEAVLLDENTVSYGLVKALPKDVRIINMCNPVEAMKGLKNQIETANTKSAHLKDGAAMAEFIFWLKQNIGKTEITELSAAAYLEACRRAQKGCYDLSFETICGYMENGAIVHYIPTEETNRKLDARGFFLVDSGGQYEDGTTDITRTIVLGPLTQQMKVHYTTVLKCHISLAMEEFSMGTTGKQLDERTRQPLRTLGLDYNHGTGHGVGHLLSVHEGPQNIGPKSGNQLPIEPGMITSNEPGVYLEGEYGIRLENEILCRKQPDGLLGFETITLCPFDREAILPELLTERELQWLNRYHGQVYEKIAPMVSSETACWLKEATKEICRN